MEFIGTFLHWAMRLAPGLVMTSLLFSLDGNLKWIGLMGPVLLVMAFMGIGCACSVHPGQARDQQNPFPGI